MCRRWTGAPFATLSWFAGNALAWQGEPCLFRSSPIAIRVYPPLRRKRTACLGRHWPKLAGARDAGATVTAGLEQDEVGMRKMLNISTATLKALELLAADRKMTVQDLVDEALQTLLKKHHRPVTTKEMFAASLKDVSRQRK